MKEIPKAYMTLAAGIPVFMVALCVLFQDVQWGSVLVPLPPLVMLAVFLRQLFTSKANRKFLHVVGGILCMVGSWFISILIIGAITISQTGLKGTQ